MKKKDRKGTGGRENTYIQNTAIPSVSFSLIFLFLHTHTHKQIAHKQPNKQFKIVLERKKHDWTLDTCLLCCHLVKREKKFGRQRGKKRILGPTGGGRLWEGNPAGVISWPWQTWLNFVVGWPVSQIPFLPLRRKDTISYLLASESVRATENSHLVWHTHTYPLYLYLIITNKIQ